MVQGQWRMNFFAGGAKLDMPGMVQYLSSKVYTFLARQSAIFAIFVLPNSHSPQLAL
jgi:hypothetical protein